MTELPTVTLHPSPRPGLMLADATAVRVRADLVPPPERAYPGVALIVPNWPGRFGFGLEGSFNRAAKHFE